MEEQKVKFIIDKNTGELTMEVDGEVKGTQCVRLTEQIEMSLNGNATRKGEDKKPEYYEPESTMTTLDDFNKMSF